MGTRIVRGEVFRLTGFEFAEALGAAIETRRGVWEFIRTFAGAWLSPLTAVDGCDEDELAALERRLDIQLPAAVREAYALLGKRPDLTSNQDRLLGPDDIDLDYAEEAVIFRVENQGAADWGIALDQLGESDPRVDIRLNMADWHDEHWEAWLPRFSLACVEIVLSESLWSSAELGASRLLDPNDVKLLEELSTRLPLPEYPTSQTAAPGIRWFAATDVLLRDDSRLRLWARARTPTALDEVRSALPGDWLSLDGN